MDKMLTLELFCCLSWWKIFACDYLTCLCAEQWVLSFCCGQSVKTNPWGQRWSSMSTWNERLRSRSTTSAPTSTSSAPNKMENSEDMKLAFMEVISDPVIIRKLESVFKPIADTITKAIQHQSQAMDSLRRQLEAKDEAIKKLTKQNQDLKARIDDLSNMAAEDQFVSLGFQRTCLELPMIRSYRSVMRTWSWIPNCLSRISRYPTAEVKNRRSRVREKPEVIQNARLSSSSPVVAPRGEWWSRVNYSRPTPQRTVMENL